MFYKQKLYFYKDFTRRWFICDLFARGVLLSGRFESMSFWSVCYDWIGLDALLQVCLCLELQLIGP